MEKILIQLVSMRREAEKKENKKGISSKNHCFSIVKVAAKINFNN